MAKSPENDTSPKAETDEADSKPGEDVAEPAPADARDEASTGDDAMAPAAADPDAADPGPGKADEDDRALEAALATSPLVASGIEPEPEPAPEPHEAHPGEHSHEEDEDHGPSLAARLLTALVLLLVGGGIALWGGPKIAPNLPSGLGSVRAWLMPGALETEARVAALEAQLDARIAAIPAGISEEQAAALAADEAADRVAVLEAQLSERIAALSDQVAAADSAEVEARLAQLESQLQGVAAEIESLGSLGGAIEGLSDAQAEEITTFTAAVDGLRAQVRDLADRQGALSQRIDDVEAAVQRRLEQAEQEVSEARESAERIRSSAEAGAALTAIEAALAAGLPFEDALARFSVNSELAVPAALEQAAPTGVVTLGALREGYADAAHAAIRATIRAAGEGGVTNRLTSFIEAQVATRSLTPQEGDSTDAILSRAEDALRRDDLAGAVAELSSLDPVARDAMRDWLVPAEARVAAQSGYVELRAAFDAAN